MLHLPEAFLPPFLEVLMPPSKGDTCPDTPSSRSQQHYSTTSIAVVKMRTLRLTPPT